jgi:hypothetical protein
VRLLEVIVRLGIAWMRLLKVIVRLRVAVMRLLGGHCEFGMRDETAGGHCEVRSSRDEAAEEL